MEALVMRHFLHFLYTGELGAALDVQLAKDLFIAADKYQVQQLKTFCEAFMSKNLTPENVSYVMVLAHLHACVGRLIFVLGTAWKITRSWYKKRCEMTKWGKKFQKAFFCN